MTKYSTTEKQPSRMFVDSLHGGGSSQITCQCGRRHYAPGNLRNSCEENDYQDMLDDCIIEQSDDPEGVVIEYDSDFIYYKELSGNVFVIDCACNGLRRYEDFLWNNRDVIRKYLKVRIDQEAEWANQELTKNKLAGI